MQSAGNACCMLSADQDSVRLLAVEACGPLARLLTKAESVQHVLPIVQKFAQASLCIFVVEGLRNQKSTALVFWQHIFI